MKRAMLLSLLLLAGCSSGPRPADDQPAEKPSQPAEKPVEKPAETPSDVPGVQTLKGDAVAWEKVLVAGKRNLVVFMTAW
ncbi:hypothetical protein PLCT2_02562 [Planctomycetaceae bacterium]|nr:hypothetical protein PLCT2_02562 [Planctomycetaceae bacterium]